MTTSTSLQTFFSNLTNDMFSFILTASIFALCWAAFLYMFAGENERRLQSVKFWLYAAMIGLAVALLAPTIAGLINAAAGGAGQ
jgi:cbb3-type cytochrome oxidase subunit 1